MRKKDKKYTKQETYKWIADIKSEFFNEADPKPIKERKLIPMSEYLLKYPDKPL